MKHFVRVPMLIIMAGLILGCYGGPQKYHKTSLPDPKSFNAHFGDIDTDGNNLVSPKEFGSYFKNNNPKIFKALDLNKDGSVDHDEWHAFKEAHGLKHKE